MKSRIVGGLFLLLIGAAGTAAAQQTGGAPSGANEPGIHGNVKLGINFSTISGRFFEGASKEFRFGGVFGGGATAALTDRVNVDVDVLYSMEGVKVKDSAINNSPLDTIKADYIRIPVLFRMAAAPGDRAPYFMVGPSFGILTRARLDPENGDSEDIKDDLKNWDLGITIGAGGNINRYFVEGRYTFGLVDINDIEGNTNKNRNQTVTGLVGVRF